MNISKLTGRIGVSIISAMLVVPTTLIAQILEEIVVTAQKREENMQDVPVAVTAYTGEQVDALGIKDFTEIIQQMPGLQLSAWSPNLTIFNLRGISQNSFADNLEPPVAVYMDDAYVGSMNALSGQMFDMKRVEVLRGPQGTLFGRNATGGLIHYLSQDASEAETNGYVEVEAGDYNRSGLEFGVGGSLSENVRARIAGRMGQMDGYIKSVDTIVPGGGPTIFEGSGQDIGGMDGLALRANFQADFSDKLQGNLWIKYSQDTEVPTGGYVFENCPFQAPPNDTLCVTDDYGRAVTTVGEVIDLFGVPVSPHQHYNEHPGVLNRHQRSVTARLDYAMDNGIDFTSITNFFSMDKFYDEDGDALAIPILTYQTWVDWAQFSQELRFAGESDNTSWQVGMYYLSMENDGGTTVSGAPGFGNVLAAGRVAAAGGVETALATGNPFNGFEGAVGAQDYLLDSSNFSVFGQADYDLRENMTVTVGLRWSQDNKEMDHVISYWDNFNSPLVVDGSAQRAAINPGVDEIDHGDWAGRLALNYRVSDSTMVFGSINRGIKGGNWSTGIGANATPYTYQHHEEVLWTLETGFKTNFEKGRLNGTFFTYDYDNYQTFSLAGGGPFVGNSDAKSYGAELEAVFYPNENWDAIVGAAFLHSEIDRVKGAFSILDPQMSDSAGDILNAEFPNAPAVSVNYLIRRNFNVGNGDLAIQLDGNYNDRQFLEVTNGSGTVQESYMLHNARLIYNAEPFSFSVWVKNLTDEIYKQYSLDLGELGATTYYGMPMTYGITARVNW